MTTEIHKHPREVSKSEVVQVWAHERGEPVHDVPFPDPARPSQDKARWNYPPSAIKDRETSVQTIAVFAPRGTIYSVVRVLSTGHRRLRLYGCRPEFGGQPLCRIDQLLSPDLFDALVAAVPYDSDKIDYNAFDNTDNTDHSGLGWTADCQSNVPLGIIYGLAYLVHGDRQAWTVQHL